MTGYRHLFVVLLVSAMSWPGSANADEETFTTADIILPSIEGILAEDCGGYCIVGACAHINYRLTWRGIRWYTIVSPKIRHAMPVLLVSSYTNPGEEPYAEWRASFGRVIAGVSGALGVAGGREDPRELDDHQSVSYKEVDVIGHPLASLPAMINSDDTSGADGSNLTRPGSFAAPNTGGRHAAPAGSGTGIDDINVDTLASSILGGSFGQGMSSIMARYDDALRALSAIDIVSDLQDAAQYFRAINDAMQAISTASEVSARSSIWVNLINPRFRVPRLLCPNKIKPLQPYYLSFADAFWWRAGYPVTDGPISGSDRSEIILNPVSTDTLPADANPLTDEVWGHLYPRGGTINQPHDAKAASVIAWRGMDVLRHSVPTPRVGVALPDGVSERQWSVDRDHPRWQMIFPEVKACQPTPHYPDPPDPGIDFMQPHVIDGFDQSSGGYAWNYYRRYTCCSNTRGRLTVTLNFPVPLCIPPGL